jgi:hypothetical protein
MASVALIEIAGRTIERASSALIQSVGISLGYGCTGRVVTFEEDGNVRNG